MCCQYVLAAPISVATKLSEDTMTYLNQSQAYEIRLENLSDVSEAKKGFMCSIINIGFHERHMQQVENELWQQWSQQHPNEKIFMVDMKLSYNVFGVESDGLNKYEFLWDTSKTAGVFIRINSISTEFTQRKHGGEKGVPFKISIETFSYNSKTHDSFFISAACCQVKVFKPKGAERKIRSDRDKIAKKPLSDQEKYHKSCDHTSFKECSLTSLHPTADSSLRFYRHSYGHFASKQVISSMGSHATGIAVNAGAVQPALASRSSDDELDQANASPQADGSSEDQSPADPSHGEEEQHTSTEDESPENRSSQMNADSDASSTGQTGLNGHQNHLNQNQHHQNNHHHQTQQQHQARDFNSEPRNNMTSADKNSTDSYSFHSRLSSHHHSKGTEIVPAHLNDNGFAPQASSLSPGYNHTSELLQLQQPNAFNQMYHSNHQAARSVVSLASISNSQHFGMAYYGHALPTSSIPQHITPSANYESPIGNPLPSLAHHSASSGFSCQAGSASQASVKGAASSILRQLSQDKASSLGASAAVTLSSSFRPPNLPSLSNHATFPPCILPSNHSVENHFDASPSNQADSKDGPNCLQESSCDSHLPHLFHPGCNAHSFNQQQPSRHRSSSRTAANSSSHCSTSYMSTVNHTGRHLDNYNNSTVFQENSNNPWSHGLTNHTHMPTQSSSCPPRGIGTHSNYDSVQNHLDDNPHHFDSDRSSPNKTHNLHINESSTGFNQQSKNSTLPSYNNNNQQDPLAQQNATSCQINANSDCSEVMAWFSANRFGLFAKTFSNFSGSDILRLSKDDLIEICGLIDGIRLYNSLHNQPIRPRRILYICQENSEVFHPIYLYNVTLKELLKELVVVLNSHKQSSSDEKQSKTINTEKPPLNLSYHSSSMWGLSSDNCSDETSGFGEFLFNNHNELLRLSKSHTSNFKSSNETGASVSGNTQIASINRLLIDGLTTVKVVATEQVVQILENKSVWKLSSIANNLGIVEACLSVCRSGRNPN